ncbi:hypothetical protein SMC26_24055 [Actinomadura fulvescens]|uniref:Uncharacterized protein n=1 Tax=Actinomadura fulvescens TaxID=46160 RepID=A0ABN3Q2Q0_9ACTN
MLVDSIDLVLEDLSNATSLCGRLDAVRTGLALVEVAVQELAFLDPLDPPPDWPELHRLCDRTRTRLARAPSFRFLSEPSCAAKAELSERDVPRLTESLIEVSNALVLTLLEAASQARNPTDEISCRSSALCCADLHIALLALRSKANRPSQMP